MHTESAPDSARPGESRPRVLVADDSMLSRRLMASALASSFDVVQASDGLEAIEHLRNDRFACVVTDDNMPGCCGLDIAEFVRSQPGSSRVPVILVTGGSASPTTRQVEGHKVGVAVFVNKPVAPEKLLGLVQMMIRMKSGEGIIRTRAFG
jgi:CheY-like chemotaxis protein